MLPPFCFFLPRLPSPHAVPAHTPPGAQVGDSRPPAAARSGTQRAGSASMGAALVVLAPPLAPPSLPFSFPPFSSSPLLLLHLSSGCFTCFLRHSSRSDDHAFLLYPQAVYLLLPQYFQGCVLVCSNDSLTGWSARTVSGFFFIISLTTSLEPGTQ